MQSSMGHKIKLKMATKKQPKDEDWLDRQDALDEVAEKIAHGDPSTPQNVKVMESLSRSIDCSALFDALCGKKQVRSLSLVGVHLDEITARRLSNTLRHPSTKIKVLQVWRFLPSCLPSLCDALKDNVELREIRLAFHGDLNHEQTTMLLEALQANQGLLAIRLFGVNLSDHAKELESLICNRRQTKELRLSRCQMTDISGLAGAIAESKTLDKLDLSMNKLSSDRDIATILQSKSLTSLILSKNQIGKENGSYVKPILAANSTLEELFLEGNPLSEKFASSLLGALHYNTSLKRLGFMTFYMGTSIPLHLDASLRHTVAMNNAGRGWLRAVSAPETTPAELALLSPILHRARSDPSALFGVLREHTNLWVKP